MQHTMNHPSPIEASNQWIMNTNSEMQMIAILHKNLICNILPTTDNWVDLILLHAEVPFAIHIF